MSGTVLSEQKSQRFLFAWSMHSWKVLLIPKFEAYGKSFKRTITFNALSKYGYLNICKY